MDEDELNTLREAADQLGYSLCPKEPPRELLISMACRYDHALLIPGYYNQQIFQKMGRPSHEQIYESTIRQMKQIYEEVVGDGFYSKENASKYRTIDERVALQEKIALAMKHKMSEEEHKAQRESYARAMEPCEHGVLDFEDCPKCRNPEEDKG